MEPLMRLSLFPRVGWAAANISVSGGKRLNVRKRTENSVSRPGRALEETAAETKLLSLFPEHVGQAGFAFRRI
jgi:hypothetical protein